MSIQALTNDLFICEQLNETLIKEAKTLGIQSVICNRPDNEESGQPNFATVQKWLTQHDILSAVYQPTQMPSINDEAAQLFNQHLHSLPKPILAYCRTGTRATTLWAITQIQQGKSVDEIIEHAERAHIDLEPIRAKLNTFSR